MARFPHTKSFDTFDFAAQPSLNKALVLELARGEWIERQRNVDALGPSDRQDPHRPRWDWPLARGAQRGLHHRCGAGPLT
jgi:hypothetical protein